MSGAEGAAEELFSARACPLDQGERWPAVPPPPTRPR